LLESSEGSGKGNSSNKEAHNNLNKKYIKAKNHGEGGHLILLRLKCFLHLFRREQNVLLLTILGILLIKYSLKSSIFGLENIGKNPTFYITTHQQFTNYKSKLVYRDQT
jgi:hypothetical protein